MFGRRRLIRHSQYRRTAALDERARARTQPGDRLVGRRMRQVDHDEVHQTGPVTNRLGDFPGFDGEFSRNSSVLATTVKLGLERIDRVAMHLIRGRDYMQAKPPPRLSPGDLDRLRERVPIPIVRADRSQDVDEDSVIRSRLQLPPAPITRWWAGLEFVLGYGGDQLASQPRPPKPAPRSRASRVVRSAAALSNPTSQPSSASRTARCSESHKYRSASVRSGKSRRIPC